MARISNAKLRHPFFQLRSSQQEQPVSAVTMAKHSRIRDAVAVDGVCPYCAVGCAQRIYVKDGQIVDIEGDKRSPINEGTLCPKGSNTFQLTVNPHRQQQTPLPRTLQRPLGNGVARVGDGAHRAAGE